MKVIFSVLVAFAVCASHQANLANAEQPKPTIGHTATLIDNTVFILGGSSVADTPSNAAFSLILGKSGTYEGSTMLDVTQLAGFSARNHQVSVKSVQGLIANCGSMDGDQGTTMTCDVFNPVQYKALTSDVLEADKVANRGGMASTVMTSGESAYFLGGSSGTTYSTEVHLLMLNDPLRFRRGTPMPAALRFHTATWVDGNVNGVVVLGGQNNAGGAIAMESASVLSASVWSTREIQGDTVAPRFGHTAVNVNGVIFVYGGKTTATGEALNDIYSLDTTAPAWTWKKINVATAEPRAFHASVLLPDGTILHTFGQSGADQATAVDTFSLFNPTSNAWTAAAKPPAATVATESPNKGPDTSNNPNDPNFEHPTGEGEGEGGGSKSNGGMIAGVIIACLAVLGAGGFLFVRRRRAQQGGSRSVRHNQTAAAGGSTYALGEDEDKTKLARSFTIRKPASVYIEDDQDLDQTHHPRYQSDTDAHNNPYYGDRTNNGGVIEYELTDTHGQKYEESTIAERKRYVEQQQRQFMDGFESVYASQQSPRSEHAALEARSPTLGSRSPRVGNQQQAQKDYLNLPDEYYH
ncbi:hypothetical protein BG011_004060 [Mortierella polycephala]|uniref:Galactose oxidase n=1 Tax=Mortierella polycephala TaxID=41804 RepID=A0A9P6PZN1_9FUNG|nr:hypothetical protein BG011_004060 [Mortierella polycephala]